MLPETVKIMAVAGDANLDVILVLGAFAGMLAGFFAFMKYIIGQGTTDRSDDRDERKALTEAIAKMAESNQLIAAATTKGNEEAKQRNGHLGEQNIQITKLITDQNKDVHQMRESTRLTAEILSKSALIAAEDRDTLLGGPGITQVVEKQVVNTQTVNKQK